MVIHFQGCFADCAGCFNQKAREFAYGNLIEPRKVFDACLSPQIKGITVSGGEPFLQQSGLYELLKIAKQELALTVVVYTGLLYEDIVADKKLSRNLTYVDVLIDGMYDHTKKETTMLARGSTNQRFIFLSNHYELNDFYMIYKSEIKISQNGQIVMTGFLSNYVK
jgi:anaerobic ribonucleoside-triphosphate reductase activating protein